MDEEPPNESDFDGIVLEESTGADEGSADLELDAFQATEIRSIFLTTLPDYLEPVKQMLEQLLSSDDPTEMRQALDTTLESIQTAASRVQIDDVSEVVQHMRAHLRESGPIAEESRDSLWAGLGRIEQLVAGVATEARPHSETLVSALGRVGDIDRGVLEKLTAAGLVTVDQIRMADPREIVAVSGLDAGVVQRVVNAVAEQPPAPAQQRPVSSPLASAPPAPDTPTGDDTLETLLRRQVEDELALEEKRGQLLRLRIQLSELRNQLAHAETERVALEKQLIGVRTEFGDNLHTLSQIGTHRARVEQEHAALLDELGRIAKRISDLEQRRRAVQDERVRFSARVSSVAQTVNKLIDSSQGETWASAHSPGDRARKS